VAATGRWGELGHAVATFPECTRVRPTAADEAEFLGLPEKFPVIEISRVTANEDRRNVEVCISVLHPYAWEFEDFHNLMPDA
jgi:DNA-binding GntR family transcriptional regulator